MKLMAHFNSFKQAWRTIFSQPVEHLINIIVLALIITLCAGSLALNHSLREWQQKNIVYPQLMVYLNTSATPADIGNVEKSLNKLTPNLVRNYQLIDKAQGLAELQKDEQMKEVASDAISADNNPLPNVLIVNTALAESSALQRLNLQLGQLPLVDSVHLDLGYAAKVSDLLNFVNQAGMFSLILAIVVLSLVLYNMIRLQMLLKSDAIIVSRLIGASDSFIMRPLIHYAVGQISLATVIAGITLASLITILNGLFANFSNLFGKGFQISQLPLIQYVALWLILVVFTIFTVFLAVRWVFRNTQAH